MTAMLRHDVGPVCAWLLSALLLLTCLLGLLSEFSIIGQTLAFWGVPVWGSNAIVSFTLLAVASTGSYHVAERIGLAMGACQVMFFVTMFLAVPNAATVTADVVKFPLAEKGFARLVTANIGAVIMPWMLAYQQSAICNKGLGEDRQEHLSFARIDTFLGSCFTQGVMAAMLVTVAAGIRPGQSVDTVHHLLDIFTNVMGSYGRARLLLTFSIVGACMVAAIVQTLCAAWTVEQAMGRATATFADGCSAEVASKEVRTYWQRFRENIALRPIFYAAYTAACIGSFLFTLIFDQAVDLSVWTEFCNGILMPPIVFTLWYMSAFNLPEDCRLGRVYTWVLFVVFSICSAFCLGSIFFSFGN